MCNISLDNEQYIQTPHLHLRRIQCTMVFVNQAICFVKQFAVPGGELAVPYTCNPL
jgi:hypothetical protein